eukprot:TRINITY_DN1066_c0_g3_i1.p1 TRINITY_DN1066_c0_g3~~TRINITY_DN1066_c0_g3_i1.p1  ORF type:complete len:128 (-),score=25.14 TRINITY_DN1066_c0_g3_i1:573-914(-)
MDEVGNDTLIAPPLLDETADNVATNLASDQLFWQQLWTTEGQDDAVDGEMLSRAEDFGGAGSVSGPDELDSSAVGGNNWWQDEVSLESPGVGNRLESLTEQMGQHNIHVKMGG